MSGLRIRKRTPVTGPLSNQKSLRMYIPRIFAESMELNRGDTLEIEYDNGSLIVTPVKELERRKKDRKK